MRIGKQDFATADDARYYIRDVLARYPVGSAVTDSSDRDFLLELLGRHPEAGKAVRAGVRSLRVVRNRKRKATELEAELSDGTRASLGWLDCLSPS